jgi:hypothetical protein
MSGKSSFTLSKVKTSLMGTTRGRSPIAIFEKSEGQAFLKFIN